MLHMQEVKEKPEADEGGTRVTVGDPKTTTQGRDSQVLSVKERLSTATANVQRVSAADENLLDDLIGTKDQAIYDRLLSAGDFDVQNNVPVVEVKIETLQDQDSQLNLFKKGQFNGDP